MGWVGNKKAYDMVSQTWIIECLKIYKISDKFINFIMEAMKNWKMELTTGEKTLAGVWKGDPKRNLPRQLTFATTVYDNYDATQLHTEEV